MSTQDGAGVRFEWGSTGAAQVAPGASVAVVVDVFSFTTSVSVAVDRGIAVHPYRWQDASAQRFAEERGAVLAGSRDAPGPVNLSPASIGAAQGVERLVLPSRNGSAIAHQLGTSGSTVVAAALRNRRAVAGWVAGRADAQGSVAVVAAGERWPDGSLRPALEDLWGAGAVIAALVDLGVDDLSPEAAAAAAAFDAVADLPASLRACTSGVELVTRGYVEDLLIAGGLDVSATVPLLVDGSFSGVPAPGVGCPP